MYAVLRHNIDRQPNGRRGSAIVKTYGTHIAAQYFYEDHDGYLEDEQGRECGLWICEYDTRLDLLRQANDYTQAGLAEATGIPLRTIQEYCQGRKPLEKASIVRCLLLAKALGCKVEDLINVSDDPSHPFADDVMMQQPEIIRCEGCHYYEDGHCDMHHMGVSPDDYCSYAVGKYNI